MTWSSDMPNIGGEEHYSRAERREKNPCLNTMSESVLFSGEHALCTKTSDELITDMRLLRRWRLREKRKTVHFFTAFEGHRADVHVTSRPRLCVSVTESRWSASLLGFEHFVPMLDIYLLLVWKEVDLVFRRIKQQSEQTEGNFAVIVISYLLGNADTCRSEREKPDVGWKGRFMSDVGALLDLVTEGESLKRPCLDRHAQEVLSNWHFLWKHMHLGSGVRVSVRI